MTEGKILIVDDEKMQRETLAKLLKMENYTVRTAANGTEALNIIDEWS